MEHNPNMVDGVVASSSHRLVKDIKIGEYIVIGNQPCKVTSIARSRDNQGTKLRMIQAVELFGNNDKVEEMFRNDANVRIPSVDLTKYEVYHINVENRHLRLRTLGGSLHERNVRAEDPYWPEIKEREVGYLWITVMSSMGIEKIVSVDQSE